MNRAATYPVYILIGAGIGALTVLLKSTLIFTSTHVLSLTHGHPVAILATLLISGLIVGLLARYVSPDIGGAGLDVSLRGFKTGLRETRPIVVACKYLATLLTVGVWGSGGFVGPLAFIGQGVASFYAKVSRVERFQSRTIALCAIGAVFTAMFGAPIAACLMAIELRFVNKVEYSRLVPVLLACVSSHLLCNNLIENETMLAAYIATVPVDTRVTLPNVARALGVALAVCFCSVLFAGTLRLVRLWLRADRLPLVIRPAFGMTAAGLAAIALTSLFQIGAEPDMLLGAGRHQFAGHAIERLTQNASLCVAILLGRILTTSLTIGSGGSGGLVWPTILIGLVASLAGMHALEQSDSPFYAAIGIATALTVLLDVPLAAIILVVEIIGGGAMIPGAIGALVGHIVGRRAIRLFRCELLEQLDATLFDEEEEPVG